MSPRPSIGWIAANDADPLPSGGIGVGFGTPAASTFGADLTALTGLLADSAAR